MISQLATSLQYVNTIVTIPDANPTTDVVAMAFTVQGVRPQSTDWKTASWNTAALVGPNNYLARCLVGPGGTVQLAAGQYKIWVKITDNPEIPQIPAGQLTIY